MRNKLPDIFRKYDKTMKYVVLIDKTYHLGLQWQIYKEYYYTEMKEKGLDTSLFYFSGDIRYIQCTDTNRWVEYDYLNIFDNTNTVLMIFTDGSSMYNTSTLNLYGWAEVLLARFRNTFILTPKPPQQWTRVEYMLDKHVLAILQSTYEGLKQVSISIKQEAKDTSIFDHLTSQPLIADGYIKHDLEANIEILKFYYKPRELAWIKKICQQDHFTLESCLEAFAYCYDYNTDDWIVWITKMCRLPWFRQGWIPDTIKDKIMKTDW